MAKPQALAMQSISWSPLDYKRPRKALADTLELAYTHFGMLPRLFVAEAYDSPIWFAPDRRVHASAILSAAFGNIALTSAMRTWITEVHGMDTLVDLARPR